MRTKLGKDYATVEFGKDDKGRKTLELFDGYEGGVLWDKEIVDLYKFLKNLIEKGELDRCVD